MKPNFALNITDTAISLLHRTSRGWLEVGSAAFDNPDLEEALGYLRTSALGLSPHGITTKLVLPASQILYIEVEAPGPDKAAREGQIRAALEGRTPYEVDDLVFDWWGTGPVVQVAVVARETLAEAEGFADAHRFNPVSFVTIPAEGKFAGEPWFGMTSLAPTVLPKGAKVTRDQDPIMVIQRDIPKAAAPKADEPPALTDAPDSADDAAKDAAAKLEAERLAEAAQKAEAEALQKAETDAKRAMEAQRTAEAEAKRAAEDDAARQKAEAARAEMELRAQELAQAEAKRLVEEAEKTKAAYQERENSRAAMIAAEQQRASSPQAAAEAEKAAFDGVADPGIADAPDSVPAPPAFTSRRRDEASPAENTVPNLGPAIARPAEPVGTGQPKVSGPAAPTITSISARAPVPVAPAPAAPTMVLKTPTSGTGPVAPKALNGTVTFPQGGKPALTPSKTEPLEKVAVTTTRIPGKAVALSRFKSKVSSEPVAAASARGDASLGKMGAKLASSRGKPRFLGLILTLVLLALLAGVAAWSSIYLSRNSTTSDPIQQAESNPVAPTDALATDADPNPVSDTEALANAEAELPPVADLSTTAPPEHAPPEHAPSAGPGPDVTADGATAQTAGPGRGPQDEIMLADTDGQPPAFDAVALPRPQARPDGAPNAAMPPPPFGTQYEFDAAGQIMATANGVIMPDGFWLIAARPPVVPPARPAAISEPETATEAAVPQATPPPEDPAANAASASTAGLGQEGRSGASSAFTQDATVESRRPKTRPAALDAPPAEAATPTEDDAALPAIDPALQRLAKLRPKARSPAAVAAAEQAQQAAAAAAATQAVEAASLAATAAAAAKSEQGSAMAVALSPRPAPRPRDFSRAVAAAVSAATRESTRRQTATAASASASAAAAATAPSGKVDPEEEHEPEVKSAAAPRIPTRANVASQATFKNAINLSKTNLIGVYGTDNKRYALIRSSNGRYTKVRVGDKVDGGTVAAITRNELRYKKGNKMLTLAMPNG